jgi:hypothetical protein
LGRLTSILAIGLLLAVCQTATPPTPSPLPSPSPHTPPTASILQSGDVPVGLVVCLGSGPIDVYVTSLARTDTTLAARVASQWDALRSEGAHDGAISLFTAGRPACSAELAATSGVKAITSFVAVFTDPGEAARAWESGVFGFIPPAPGELPPGISRGTATGLGLSSWTADRAPVRLACWHRSVFVALIVATNLDVTTFKTATAAVDARLN